MKELEKMKELENRLILYNKIKNMPVYQDEETQKLLNEIIELTKREIEM